jgi:hypothetical protein
LRAKAGSEEKISLHAPEGIYNFKNDLYNLVSVLQGGIAQLGERLHGMQEVSGSIPLTSTKEQMAKNRWSSMRSCFPVKRKSQKILHKSLEVV